MSTIESMIRENIVFAKEMKGKDFKKVSRKGLIQIIKGLANRLETMSDECSHLLDPF